MLACSFAYANEAVPVHASQSPRSTSALLAEQPVYERTQPGFEVPGMHLGDLLLHPSVQVMEVFDSNVYATQANQKSDLTHIVAPAMTVDTQNPNRGFQFKVENQSGFYTSNTSENFSDTHLTLMPYLRMSTVSTIKARVLWERAHELRTSDAANTNFGAEEPVRYTQSMQKLFWEYKPSRLGFTPFIQHNDIAYENVARRGGGPKFVNNDRDRAENEIGTEISYDFFGKDQAYVRVRGFSHDYVRPDYNPLTLSYSGSKRDSKGFESRLGVNYYLTPITSLDMNGGFYRQNFEATAFKPVTTPVGHALLTWRVTALTTCNIEAERQAWETNQVTASAFVQNRAGARITHELRRNVILGTDAGIGTNSYVGDPRQDHYWQAGLSSLYKISRNWGWKTAYSYEQRQSNTANADYSKHQLYLSLQAQF